MNFLAPIVQDGIEEMRGLTDGDYSFLESAVFVAGGSALFVAAVVGFSALRGRSRQDINTLINLRGWMERQGAVLSNSIAPHCHETTKAYYRTQRVRLQEELEKASLPKREEARLREELKRTCLNGAMLGDAGSFQLFEAEIARLKGALAGNALPLQEREQLEAELLEIRKLLKRAKANELVSGTWFHSWDLPAPASYKMFQLYTTPWSFIRCRIDTMRENRSREVLTFGNGDRVELNSTTWDLAVKICRKAGWTYSYVKEMQGPYPRAIRRALQRVDRKLGRPFRDRRGPPEEKLRMIYETGVAFVADMRGPKDNPGQGFKDQADREKGMEELAKVFWSYLQNESQISKPFDTPWNRVFASLAHEVAMETQVSDIEHDHPNLRYWDMRFSVEEQLRLAKAYAEEFRKIGLSRSRYGAIMTLAAQKGWEMGKTDSLNWYRGTRNFQQAGAPLVTDTMQKIEGDKPIMVQRWEEGAMPAMPSITSNNFNWERAQYASGGPGLQDVPEADGPLILKTMIENSDFEDSEAARRTTTRKVPKPRKPRSPRREPGSKGPPRGPDLLKP